MHKATKRNQGSRTSNILGPSAGTNCGLMTPIPPVGQNETDLSPRHYWIVCGSGKPSAVSTPRRADVITRGREILVMAELPGKDKYIDISLTGIGAEGNRGNNDHYRCVITRGECTVTVSLPADVDTTRTKAEFKHGVLKLVIPKNEAGHDAMILD